MTIRYSA